MKKLMHQLVLGLLCSIFAWMSFGWFVPAGLSLESDHATDTSLLSIHSATHALLVDERGRQNDIRGGTTLSSGQTIRSFKETGVEIQLSGGSRVRLAPDTTLKVLKLSSSVDSPHQLLLLDGEVWAYSVAASPRVDVYLPGGATVTSEDNVFDVSVRDGTLSVFAAKNPVRVSLFLPQRLEVSKFTSNAISYLNSILVTERSVLHFVLAKLDPKFEKLLYSKLIKEFQYAPISDEQISQNSWFSLNGQLDRLVTEAQLQRLTNAMKKRNLVVSAPDSLFEFVRSRVQSAGNFLTFDDDRRRDSTLKALLVHIDDALYFSSVSNEKKAIERVQFFLQQIPTYTSDRAMMVRIEDALWQRFHQFSILTPKDGGLFRIRDELRTALLGLNQAGYSLAFDRQALLVRSYLSDVFSTFSVDSSLAQNFLQQYFQASERFFFTFGNEIKTNPESIFEESQLLSRLFLASPLFYKDQYFEQKFKMESQWLSLVPDKDDRAEEAQTMATARIDLLRYLRKYFFDELVAPGDARSVLYRLLTALSQTSQVTPDSEVAASFRDIIREQQSFWLFLNNSEFSESSLHGKTQKDRFTSFMKNQERQKEIRELQKSLFGSAQEVSSPPEVQQTLLEIQDAFRKVAVSKLHIAPLLDRDQPQVFVDNAEYNGISFSAIYDREKSLISDVKVFGETVLSSAIPLSKLPSIFRVKSSTSDLLGDFTQNSDSPPDEESLAKVTAVFLAKKLQILGFELTADQVQSIDETGKIFAVSEARLPLDQHPIVANFDIRLSDYRVSSVSVAVLGKRLSMPGEVTLDNFSEALRNFYEQAFYESVTPAVSESETESEPNT